MPGALTARARGAAARLVTAAAFTLLCAPISFGDAQGRAAVEAHFGLAGEVVADAWNPLRFLLRDLASGEVTLLLDRGTLRDGERIVTYELPFRGGAGLTALETDLHLPAWRTLTWTVRSGGTTVATGSLDRRHVDPQPLHVVVTIQASTYRTASPPDARIVEALPSELPPRSAAFTGVATLLLDGTTAPPAAEALLAAAAAGTRVLLVEPLPATYGALERLAPGGSRRYGLGSIERVTEAEALDRLAGAATDRIDAAALETALVTPDLLEARPSFPTTPLFVAFATYCLVVGLAVRFGGAPGVIAALSVALIGSTVAWSTLRPPSEGQSRSRTLELSAGGLALALELRAERRYARGVASIDAVGRVLEPLPYRSTPARVEVPLRRWDAATVALRPRLDGASFGFDGSALVNGSRRTMTDVYVIGRGPQPDLPPDARASVATVESTDLPSLLYSRLLALLPEGTALASSGEVVFVAFPDGPGGREGAWR